VADIKAQRLAAHERGYEDDVLDGLAMIPRVVSAWSFGAVTEDVLDNVSRTDVETLAREMAPMGEAVSTSSSAGGNSRKANRPSNG